MRLLYPSLVSGEIMKLLNDARKHVVIVSPYNKIKNWYKLAPYLRRLKERSLPVEYFVRKETPRSPGVQEVIEAGFNPIEVEGLHCKFYLNETYGIVTSMNLLLSSDINAIEIGYVTETQREYDELIDFLESNIRNRLVPPVIENSPAHEVQPIEEATIQAPDDSLNEGVLETAATEADTNALSLDGVSNTAFELLGRNSLFSSCISKSGRVILGDLAGGINLHIDFRRNYVQVAYSFPRSVRWRLYKALYAQRQELEAKIAHPLSWGNQMHRLKLEVTAQGQRSVSNWGKDDVAQLCLHIERATPIIQEYAQQWVAVSAS